MVLCCCFDVLAICILILKLTIIIVKKCNNNDLMIKSLTRSGNDYRVSVTMIFLVKHLRFYPRTGQASQWKYRKTREIISLKIVFASIFSFVKDEISDRFCMSPKGEVLQCTWLQLLQVDLIILSENCATAIQRYHKLYNFQEKTVYFIDLGLDVHKTLPWQSATQFCSSVLSPCLGFWRKNKIVLRNVMATFYGHLVPGL